MKYCFQRIASAIEADIDGNQISRLTAYLNELLVIMLDMFRNQHVKRNKILSTKSRTVELFLADLKSNPESLASQLAVSQMAKSCGLGTTHFIHHCNN